MRCFAEQPALDGLAKSRKRGAIAARRCATGFRILAGLLTCLAAFASHANLPSLEVLDRLVTPTLLLDPADTAVNKQERSWFEQAEKALKRGHKQQYQELKARLREYPLYPYLELRELQARFHVATTSEVSRLLDLHSEVPLAAVVRIQWLHELSRRKSWRDLLAQMPSPAPTKTLECLALQARLKTGNKREVAALMPSLWLTGKSLPDACDPVIEAWRRDGGLTADLAWQRSVLAVEANNTGLAKYLKRFLPAELRQANDLLRQVHHSPERLENTRGYTPGLARISEIVAHGMVQYSRRDPLAASALWAHYRDTLPFTSAQLLTVNRSLGLMLAVRYLPQAQALLREASADEAEPNLFEWQARVHLRNGAWAQVAETITGFPSELRNTARWQYWLARAEEATGAHDAAQTRYATAAAERNFYGFLAADRLGTPYRLNHQAHPFNAEDLAEVHAMPTVERAYEFFQMGRLFDARREWRGLLERLDRNQVLVASQLAQSWGWHEQGIKGAVAVQEWDDLQIRFPLAHEALFSDHAALRKLDVNWVYALARQESAFMEDARSPAGALGLLQLMPATARQTAREIGLPFRGNHQLLEPAQNILLGTAHLSELLAKFDNNRILATAAYNAGAHRVTGWLKDGGDRLDADVWIETMPYHETRQYVQNVLAYTVIYGFRRGEPPLNLLTARELACLCLPTKE